MGRLRHRADLDDRGGQLTPRPRLLVRIGPAFAERDFALLWVAQLAMGVAVQMVQVAIGWQVFANHRDPLLLGLVGLAEFVPMVLLALPAGQLADRLPRRLVFATSLGGAAAVCGGLVAISAAGVTAVGPFLALAFASGCVAAIGTPAARALPPVLVPPELLSNAMTLRSIAFQGSQVTGPALGGGLFALGPVTVYSVAAVLCGIAALLTLAMRPRPAASAAAARPAAPGLESLFGGLRFLVGAPIILGAILLDLFAVLFGGAVGLLPVFAQEILLIGPFGLGLLRAAPALGALVAAAWLTRRPLGGRAGRTLLLAVAAFGVSILVFGLSRSPVLSFAALAASGFFDMFSVNIRSTTVALATPDEVRGRVLAVEMVFISASNQLGAFESGVAAAAVGTVPAVVAGGLITVAIAATWGRLFPALARVDRLEDVRPETPARA